MPDKAMTSFEGEAAWNRVEVYIAPSTVVPIRNPRNEATTMTTRSLADPLDHLYRKRRNEAKVQANHLTVGTSLLPGRN